MKKFILKSGRYRLFIIQSEFSTEEKWVIFEIIRGGGDTLKLQPHKEEYVNIIVHELYEMELDETQIEKAINLLLKKQILFLRKDGKSFKKFKINFSDNKEMILELRNEYYDKFYEQYLKEKYRNDLELGKFTKEKKITQENI